MLLTGHQQPVHQLVGVAQAFVDVHARMPAVQSAYGEPVAHMVGGCGFGDVAAAGRHVHPAGAADGELVVVLGVQVQQVLGVQQAALQLEGAGHAGLLVDGEERLQRGVGDVRAGQQRHDGGDADAVVRAQRGALGLHPVAVHLHADAFGGEVEVGVVVLLVHHVQVALQGHGGGVLLPFGARLADDHVAGMVHFRRQAEPFAEGLREGDHALLVLAGPGHGVQVGEVVPERLGLQVAYGLAHGRAAFGGA